MKHNLLTYMTWFFTEVIQNKKNIASKHFTSCVRKIKFHRCKNPILSLKTFKILTFLENSVIKIFSRLFRLHVTT